MENNEKLLKESTNVMNEEDNYFPGLDVDIQSANVDVLQFI